MQTQPRIPVGSGPHPARVRADARNRSFDHLFALSGYPDIVAASPGNSNAYGDAVYPFGGGAPGCRPIRATNSRTCSSSCAARACRSSKEQPYPPVVNTGFVSNYATSHSEGTPPQPADAGKIMQGVDIATRAPSLHAFANAFVLCDAWHASMPGPT